MIPGDWARGGTHIVARLLGHGCVANPRGTDRYRCGLRLAMNQSASFLSVPSRVKRCIGRRLGSCLIGLSSLLQTLRTNPQCHGVLRASFVETPSGECWCSHWPEYRGGA